MFLLTAGPGPGPVILLEFPPELKTWMWGDFPPLTLRRFVQSERLDAKKKLIRSNPLKASFFAVFMSKRS